MRYVKRIKGNKVATDIFGEPFALPQCPHCLGPAAGSRPMSVSHEQFYQSRLLDPRFSETGPAILKCASILAAIERSEKADADHYAFEDEHYEMLSLAIDSPSPKAGYIPALAHNLAEYVRAHGEATRELAREKRRENSLEALADEAAP